MNELKKRHLHQITNSIAPLYVPDICVALHDLQSPKKLPPLSAAHKPDDEDAEQGTDDTHGAQTIARALRRLVHGPADRIRKRRKKNALDRENEAEGCYQIPHLSRFHMGYACPPYWAGAASESEASSIASTVDVADSGIAGASLIGP